MAARRSGEDKEPRAPVKENPPDTSAAADLGASIAEHAIRLAHLYCDRARMFYAAGEKTAATRDKSRAEDLYQWALQAAESTITAGHDALRPELEELKAELDSFHQLSKAVTARG